MIKFKGSQTEKLLLAAFAGESQARNRYTYFASAARKEEYEQIAALFAETADNEKEHAKVFFRFLEGGEAEITATYPAGKIGTTLDNLRAAAAGENMEWMTLYPQAAKVAQKEGFKEVAEAFSYIAKVEKEHEKRYLALAKNVKGQTVYKKSKTVRWHCRNCGYVHEGTEAPRQCPSCKHPQSFFEVYGENY